MSPVVVFAKGDYVITVEHDRKDARLRSEMASAEEGGAPFNRGRAGVARFLTVSNYGVFSTTICRDARRFLWERSRIHRR